VWFELVLVMAPIIGRAAMIVERGAHDGERRDQAHMPQRKSRSEMERLFCGHTCGNAAPAKLPSKVPKINVAIDHFQ
jgi:hypothetical protein